MSEFIGNNEQLCAALLHIAGRGSTPPTDKRVCAKAANRIEELEAKLAKAVEGFTVIDALDPEGFVNGCSQSALKGLVLRMGETARDALAELKGNTDEKR